MLLEKYENLLELSDKQLVIKPSFNKFDFPRPGCLVCEKPNVVCSKVRCLSYPARVIQV